MIASLPMYDLPDCRAANDRYWVLIRDGLRERGIATPDTLMRGIPDLLAHWQQRNLVMSQTCGFPFRAVLHGKVALIGTPDFGLEGCPPGYYQSIFMVRKDDDREGLTAFKEARFAYNDALSQSGWAAPQHHAAGLGFQFTSTLHSGAHAASAHAVLEGKADIAAVDAMTWRLLQRNDASMAGLREIARTEPTPGLPYIAALGANHKGLFEAIAAAISALSPADRDTLGLRRILYIPAVAYQAIPTPAAPLVSPQTA